MKVIIIIALLASSHFAHAFSSPLQISKARMELALAAFVSPETVSILSIENIDKGVEIKYLSHEGDGCYLQLIPMVHDEQGMPTVLETPLPPKRHCH